MIEGLAHLEKVLDGMTDVRKPLIRSAYLVENKAKQGCPVDTGRLRASITHRFVADDEVIVGTNVVYAPYVEFGTGMFNVNGRKDAWRYQSPDGEWHTTHGHQAQPFLYPALTGSRKEIHQIFIEEIKHNDKR